MLRPVIAAATIAQSIAQTIALTMSLCWSKCLRVVAPLILLTSVLGSPALAQPVVVTYTPKADLGTIGASYPLGTPVFGIDGALYGTTMDGGTNACGTIFRLAADNTLTLLHSFVRAQGCVPAGEIAVGPDGSLYGTTYQGGDSPYFYPGLGTIYKLATDGTFTSLHSFQAGNDGLGSGPYGGLTMGADGYLYGTTTGGSSQGGGIVFRISPSGDSFAPIAQGMSNPQSALTIGSDGQLYGTELSGVGGVFRISLAGVLERVFSFPYITPAYYLDPLIAPYGINPLGEVIEGPDGSWYGTTTRAGSDPAGSGTVFRLTPANGGSWNINTLHEFAAPDADGRYPLGAVPWAGLTLGSDGSLYGTTYGGGSGNSGTIFSVSPTGSFAVLHSFTGAEGGGPQEARLVETSPGVFIGLSTSGVFELTVTHGVPTAQNQGVQTDEDQALAATLIASDPNNDPLVFSVVNSGTLGIATITNSASGAFTYVPNPNVNGTDTFTFQATDGTYTSGLATVTVTIAPVNDKPQAFDAAFTVDACASSIQSLIATDIDSASVNFSIVSNGSKGVASITNAATGAFTYTASCGTSGTDSFTFKANDGLVDSNIATVTVTIIPSAACAVNVTSSVSAALGSFRVDRKTGHYFQKVTLKNTSSSAISGPVSFVLDALTAGTTVVGGAGVTICTTPAGSPYVTVNIGSDGILSSRERANVSVEFVLELVNPGSALITYRPRILAGAGAR